MACSKSVPQRLKPRFGWSGYGTAEAVPLSKTDVSTNVVSIMALHIERIAEISRV